VKKAKPQWHLNLVSFRGCLTTRTKQPHAEMNSLRHASVASRSKTGIDAIFEVCFVFFAHNYGALTQVRHRRKLFVPGIVCFQTLLMREYLKQWPKPCPTSSCQFSIHKYLKQWPKPCPTSSCQFSIHKYLKQRPKPRPTSSCQFLIHKYLKQWPEPRPTSSCQFLIHKYLKQRPKPRPTSSCQFSDVMAQDGFVLRLCVALKKATAIALSMAVH